MLKLVGDNPFNGVSHLSQEKAMSRDVNISDPKYAAKLVKISLDNGADGFMFSISDVTLSILRTLREEYSTNTKLYAITPAAGESARNMGASGGVEGLVKKSAKQAISSRNLKAMSMGIVGSASMNPDLLLRSFISLEISRIKAAAGKHADIESLMLHEIVTDLALALDLDWLLASYIDFVNDLGIMPGFETRNFVYLVRKFKAWNFDISKVSIAAPFNRIGFQMIPSQVDCENTLASLSNTHVIAISVLAAGYLKPVDACGYVKNLSNLNGIAVAVSNMHHAQETFRFF